jgi:DNA topoisomerase-3
LFGVLKRADPDLVDPGVTARLECLLDDVVLGKQEMIGAIDAVCEVAQRIIGKLTESSGGGPPLLGARGGGGARPPASTMKPCAGKRTRQKNIKSSNGRSKSGGVSRTFIEQAAGNELDAMPGKAVARSAVASAGAGSNLDAAGGKRGRTSKKAPTRRPRRATANAAPSSVAHPPASGPQSATETPLRIPFGNKAIALDLGARYRSGGWYAPPGVDLAAFGERGWL